MSSRSASGRRKTKRWRILERMFARGTSALDRAGAAGGTRRLQAAAVALDGDRDACRSQAARRRRGHRRVRAKPAPAAAGAAAGPEARAGDRPRVCAQAARRWCSTRRGSSLRHDVIYLEQSATPARRRGRCELVAWHQGRERSPSATAPAAARRRRSSARLACRAPSRGDGERVRRVGLLGFRRRARGVPGLRHDRPRRGFDRPAVDGPAGGAGQARPQEHRRRPVPARRRPGRVEASRSTTWSVSCVNAVGVEVNTASKQLLAYVSGLNATIADNIVRYRNEHGPFKRRRKSCCRCRDSVPKAFEQAAGFLRIRGAPNPLDASAVHPESYRRRPHGGGPGRRRRAT